jgi:hypothetical protein
LVAGLLRKPPQALLLSVDPQCKRGLANIEMTACCQADCGDCNDNSTTCLARETNGRGTTCCPFIILEDTIAARSCDSFGPPCQVSEEVRTYQPTLEELTAASNHAKDDCGKAVVEEKGIADLNTHYVKFEGKTTGSDVATSDCGNYGTVDQAAAACSNTKLCLGFTVEGTSPSCLLSATNEIEELSSDVKTTYLKRTLGYTDHVFQLKRVAQEPGCCNATDDKEAGQANFEPACVLPDGTEAELSFCSYVPAISADALSNYGLQTCSAGENSACPNFNGTHFN